MAAEKKSAKKKIGSKTWTWTINDDGSFTPDPLDGIKNGDRIKVVVNPDLCFDITVKIKKVKCGGGGGGPIVIHS